MWRFVTKSGLRLLRSFEVIFTYTVYGIRHRLCHQKWFFVTLKHSSDLRKWLNSFLNMMHKLCYIQNSYRVIQFVTKVTFCCKRKFGWLKAPLLPLNNLLLGMRERELIFRSALTPSLHSTFEFQNRFGGSKIFLSSSLLRLYVPKCGSNRFNWNIQPDLLDKQLRPAGSFQNSFFKIKLKLNYFKIKIILNIFKTIQINFEPCNQWQWKLERKNKGQFVLRTIWNL